MIRVTKTVVKPVVRATWSTPPDPLTGAGVIELHTPRLGVVLYAVQRVPADPSVAVEAVAFQNLKNGQRYNVCRRAEGWLECDCPAYNFQHSELKKGCKHTTAFDAITWPKPECAAETCQARQQPMQKFYIGN